MASARHQSGKVVEQNVREVMVGQSMRALVGHFKDFG